MKVQELREDPAVSRSKKHLWHRNEPRYFGVRVAGSDRVAEPDFFEQIYKLSFQMPYQIYTLSLHSTQDELEKLNGFLRSNRIVQVTRQFVEPKDQQPTS